ncbi:MAG: alginate export family protein [Erythrobacter sp.]|nr:alginate export family protein [Erythrobacter sp.]
MTPRRCLMRAAAILLAALLAGAPVCAAGQDAGSAVSASFGAEARLRYEGYDEPAWGDATDDAYLWLRLIPRVQIEAGPAAVVIQPIIAHAIGVTGGPGPTDRTSMDLLQAYAELRQPLGEDTKVSLRAGRMLIALGSQRLVGTRYGPNVPQPFDGVQASLTRGSARLDLIDARAVTIGPDAFDDSSSGGRRLRSAYLTAEAVDDVHFDLYWIGYYNPAARMAGLIGAEARDTFGLRLFGARGRVSWNWETMVQRGAFAGHRIRAWSQATETAITFPGAPLAPQLRLRANIASGDRAATAGSVESFNAMFPKGRYFGELTPIGPRNIVNVNPGLVLSPAERLRVELNFAAFWRASRTDSIYDVAGREIRAAGTSQARHIGNLAEASLAVDLDNGLSLSVSLGAFTAGPYIRQTGLGETILMVGTEANIRF